MVKNEWVPNLSNEDYHARKEFMSSSKIRALLQSPRHYFWQFEKGLPDKPSKAKDFGTLIHTAILEPERFRRDLKISPAFDKRTKAGKAAFEDFRGSLSPDAILVTQEEFDRILGTLEAVYDHPIARGVLVGGKREWSGFFNRKSSVLGKIRPDMMLPDQGLILDVKTTQSAERRACELTILRYHYHAQAAWYLEGASIIEGRPFDKYAFLFVETNPPFNTSLFVADGALIEAGEIAVEKALKAYDECKKSGVWYGYQRESETISLPAFALNQIALEQDSSLYAE